MPSIPALPLLALTRHIASFRFPQSHISSINRSVQAGLSGSCVVGGDSISFLPGSWASPGPEEEKSNSPWMFGRLSLLRFMIDLPLRLVQAFGPRSRLGLSVDSTFRIGVPH